MVIDYVNSDLCYIYGLFGNDDVGRISVLVVELPGTEDTVVFRIPQDSWLIEHAEGEIIQKIINREFRGHEFLSDEVIGIVASVLPKWRWMALKYVFQPKIF